MAENEYFQGDRLEITSRYDYRPEFIPLLMNYLGAQSNTRILEAGCGTGFFSRLLAKNLVNVQIDAVDISENLLNMGQELLKRDQLEDVITLQKGDAYNLPFPDETFDVVTSHTMM